MKKLARKLPIIGDLLLEIEQLRHDNEHTMSALSKAHDELLREHEALITTKASLAEEVESLRQRCQELSAGQQTLEQYRTWVPPGHFYSPIPSLNEVSANEKELFDKPPQELFGLDLREKQQLELLHEFSRYYAEMPFSATQTSERRYYFENPAYSYSDAIVLYSMIRHLQPKRIIEVGSGFSSCVTLDTNELFFRNAISCTFIEPYPDLLHSLLRSGDEQRITIVPEKLQSVPFDRFSELEPNDILFIDSTHVSKIGSDVNRIFFDILPNLKPGVFIHFHDIFYPFEYPKAWIYEGRAWNELYLLRSFLQYNKVFQIEFFSTFLARYHADKFAAMPLCRENFGGNIWLKKCR